MRRAAAAVGFLGLASGRYGGHEFDVAARGARSRHHGRRQAVRRHPGAGRRVACALPRRNPCAARRERRRQVDADQDHDRRSSARSRRDPAERRAGHDRQRGRGAAEGVAAIYQEPLLFPDLNVAENIFISHQGRGAVVGWADMFREAEAILAKLGVALDVRSPARGLTLAAQQSVEIAKAISLNVRVLIMDEPTASLSAHEAQELFRLVRDLQRQGVAILFVSHRMEEVFEIADKITVFRDGRLISTRPRAEATPASAIADMVGREIGLSRRRAAVGAAARCCCRCRGLGRARRVRGRDLRPPARRGAGLRRADRRRADRRRARAVRHRAGDLGHHRACAASRSPSARRRRRCGSASPMCRRIAGSSASSLPMSISANITLPALRRYLDRFGLVRTRQERRDRGGVSHAARHPHALGRSCRRQAVGRQPAEGDAEQVAQHQSVDPDPRRADARHRRRLQGRGARDHRRTRRRGHRRHRHLVRPAGGAGAVATACWSCARGGRWRSSTAPTPTRRR